MEASIIKGISPDKDVIIEHKIKNEDSDSELNALDDWLEENTSEELDNSWVEKYKILEKDYNKFYKEKCKKINIYFFYVNENNAIESMVKIDYLLNENGKILKNNLIYLIKNYQYFSNKKYQLISLLKYNFTVEPEEVIDFTTKKGDYLSSQRFLDDITFEDTITIFQDLNSLFFVFYSKKPSTRTTKKVIINQKNRKTKRKKLKAGNT